MNKVQLPSGEQVPSLGLGTWRYGEDVATREKEITSIRLGLDFGATVIDTAEMYGDGRAEELLAEALKGRRDEAYIVSKVLPHNASRKGTVTACEGSLRRLGTDRIDLYLLHWRGGIGLSDTFEAFAKLQETGKIRLFGVSNFDLKDMQDLDSIPGGSDVATNQLLHNLTRRGIEWDLLPWLRQRRIPIMAYSPIEQARILGDKRLIDFSLRHNMTPSQAALAWLLAQSDHIVIPKSSDPERVRENFGALQHPLTPDQLRELNALFPPPTGPSSLEML
jgi:diketogulonate reductase-like aldo/keto reductase